MLAESMPWCGAHVLVERRVGVHVVKEERLLGAVRQQVSDNPRKVPEWVIQSRYPNSTSAQGINVFAHSAMPAVDCRCPMRVFNLRFGAAEETIRTLRRYFYLVWVPQFETPSLQHTTQAQHRRPTSP
jgi:hypothetical protein